LVDAEAACLVDAEAARRYQAWFTTDVGLVNLGRAGTDQMQGCS
jgi:hypothetical protein